MILLMSSVKFLLALPLAAFQYEFSFWQTFLLSSIGGLLGIFVFAYLSHFIIDKYSSWMSNRQQENSKDSIKKVVAVKTVKKYGLFGIAFLTPIFFSIPLGTFIALRFFPNKKKTLPVLAAAVFGWSFVLSFALTIL
jgi:membrane protein YqaA with SNARE-associated domain